MTVDQPRLSIRTITQAIAAQTPDTTLRFEVDQDTRDVELILRWREGRGERHTVLATRPAAGTGVAAAYHRWLGELLTIWQDRGLTVAAVYARHDAREAIDLRSGTTIKRGAFAKVYTIGKRDVCIRAADRFGSLAEMDGWVAGFRDVYAGKVRAMAGIPGSPATMLYCDISHGAPGEAIMVVALRSALRRRNFLPVG
jgi:hypothetical protein